MVLFWLSAISCLLSVNGCVYRFIVSLTMAASSHSVFASIGNPITAAMLKDMIKRSPLVTENNTYIFSCKKGKAATSRL